MREYGYSLEEVEMLASSNWGLKTRRCLAEPRKAEISLETGTLLDALRSHEELRSGSVVVRIVRQKRTVILVGQDLLAEINSQKELPLK